MTTATKTLKLISAADCHNSHIAMCSHAVFEPLWPKERASLKNLVSTLNQVDRLVVFVLLIVMRLYFVVV